MFNGAARKEPIERRSSDIHLTIDLTEETFEQPAHNGTDQLVYNTFRHRPLSVVLAHFV